MFKESFKSLFAKSVLSGMMIGIGGTVYLLVENKYLGAFLFSLGLFAIVQFGFSLYTGKVGYIPENKPKYILEVLVTFIGNVLGTFITSLIIRATRIGSDVSASATACMQVKSADSFWSVFFMALMCGILMYIAVHNAKISREKNNDTALVFGVVMPIIVFILCGFNHSVADSFYIFMCAFQAKYLLYLLIAFLGNAVGCMLIPAVKKFCFDKPKIQE